VDYRTTVWVNGQEVGHNEGGHVPFQFDIAPYVRAGANRLALRVVDEQNARQPRGKQSADGLSHDIDYYCTTGIWQTVWLEPVPPLRIEEIRITPQAQRNVVELSVYLHAPSGAWRLVAEASEDGRTVARAEDLTAVATGWLSLSIPYAKLWSPESPHLYDLDIRLYDGEVLLDEVRSYAGSAHIEMRDGRVRLNGEPVYLKMVLDQGYWPESYLAAPSDEALQADIGWAKAFGFNGVRKHQKIEDPRWLYWCDRLGVLVWEEMPNAREWSPQAEERLSAEWRRAVQARLQSPLHHRVGSGQREHGLPRPRPAPPRPVRLHRAHGLGHAPARPDAPRHRQRRLGAHGHHGHLRHPRLHADGRRLARRYRVRTEGGELPPTVWLGDKPLFARGSRTAASP
jgi:beta-galactosidase/beta-glucuronidase